MAVPKKRTSKAKKRNRKNIWKKKAFLNFKQMLNIKQYLLKAKKRN